MTAVPPLKRICGAVIALAALAGTASAPGATEIRTAAQEATEPKFVIADRQRAIDGICIDIMRAIERVDRGLHFVGDQIWEPLVRVEAGVAGGTLDAACGFLRNSVRETKFDYLEPPLFTVTYHLAVRKDDEVQVSNWNDVRNLGDQGVVLVINGFGMIKKLHDIGGLRIDAGATDSKTNLEKLAAGRGRFYIHRSPGIRSEIRKAGMNDKVRLLPTVMHSETFHMVVSRKLDAEAVERMRQAIATLDKRGELKKILERWDSY